MPAVMIDTLLLRRRNPFAPKFGAVWVGPWILKTALRCPVLCPLEGHKVGSQLLGVLAAALTMSSVSPPVTLSNTTRMAPACRRTQGLHQRRRESKALRSIRGNERRQERRKARRRYPSGTG